MAESIRFAPNRKPGIAHRSAITAVDKLAVPGTLTVTAVTESGSTLTNVARHVAVAAYNRWGVTTVSTGSVTPTLSQAVRIAFAAVTGADGYDIFLSTDANPKWVGRVTEAQRAAGGIFSAVGTLSAGGTTNAIDVGIDGTGLASNVNPFAVNNAYTPSLITQVNCAGASKAHILVKLAVTDLRSLPALSVVPFMKTEASDGDWYMGTVQAVSLLTAVGQALQQSFDIDVNGAAGLALLVDAISGQGAAMSAWVELS